MAYLNDLSKCAEELAESDCSEMALAIECYRQELLIEAGGMRAPHFSTYRRLRLEQAVLARWSHDDRRVVTSLVFHPRANRAKVWESTARWLTRYGPRGVITPPAAEVEPATQFALLLTGRDQSGQYEPFFLHRPDFHEVHAAILLATTIEKYVDLEIVSHLSTGSIH